nr:hypothetical protein CFP56_35148 [Quercus suber]
MLEDMVWTRSSSDCGNAPTVRPDPSREGSSHGDEEIILAGERRGEDPLRRNNGLGSRPKFCGELGGLDVLACYHAFLVELGFGPSIKTCDMRLGLFWALLERFSKQKLTKAQEKKAKGGLVSGLLSRKRLKVIAFAREETKKKNKVVGKSFLPSFWDDADVAALKAHTMLSMDDLSPLMVKSSSEALGESLFISGKLLDLEKKVSIAEPMIKSLSIKNETLKNKVAILAVEAENDKEHVAALEKSLQVEKDFCKLKDKQMGDLQLKLQKAGAMALQEFKDSTTYSNELCEYYVEGFELFRKWMAKHHPNLDLFGLVMGDVEKELLSDRPSEATAENVMEEATTVAEVIDL